MCERTPRCHYSAASQHTVRCYARYDATRAHGIIPLLLDVLRRLRTSPPPPRPRHAAPPTGFGRAHFPLVFGGAIPNPDRAERRRRRRVSVRSSNAPKTRHGKPVVSRVRTDKTARAQANFNAGTQSIECKFLSRQKPTRHEARAMPSCARQYRTKSVFWFHPTYTGDFATNRKRSFAIPSGFPDKPDPRRLRATGRVLSVGV